MEVGMGENREARWQRWRSSSSIRRIVGITLGVASALVLFALPSDPNATATGSPARPDAFRILRGADIEDLCLTHGGGEVRGRLTDDAVLTMILSPKDVEAGERTGESLGNNNGNLNHLRHLMYSWANTTRVNFLVVSKNCAVRKLADDFDLPMVYRSSGSDMGDLTYKHLLQVVKDVSSTPFFGFVNGDIMFDEGLPKTVDAAIRFRAAHPDSHIAITGQRRNTDAALVPLEKPIESGLYKAFLDRVRQNNQLYMKNAEDYFIFDRESPLDIKNLKPFLLGGVGFDNYLNAEFQKLDRDGKLFAVDATNTINAYHVNHGSHGKKDLSHETVASVYNTQLSSGLDSFYRSHKLVTHNPTMTEWEKETDKDKKTRVKFVVRATGLERE